MESINVLGRTVLRAVFTASNIAFLRSEMLMSQLCAKVQRDRSFLSGDCLLALAVRWAQFSRSESCRCIDV